MLEGMLGECNSPSFSTVTGICVLNREAISSLAQLTAAHTGCAQVCLLVQSLYFYNLDAA